LPTHNGWVGQVTIESPKDFLKPKAPQRTLRNHCSTLTMSVEKTTT